MDGLLSLTILQVLLIICLDRDDVLSLLVCGPPDNRESALANLEMNLELLKIERLLLCELRPALVN